MPAIWRCAGVNAFAKAHAIEFLRIVGWDEFKQMMDEAEAQKKAKEASQAEEVEGEKSGS